MQTTPLDFWFGSAEDKLKLSKQKNVFYFDSKTMKSCWLNEKPSNVTFSLIIKWNKVPITICTNCPQDHNYKIPKENKYNDKHMTFIKSNLQKCVRRKLNEKAVKTAYHMIKLNLNEFVRRISIIIIEDVILHECYSTICWLIAATASKKSIFKPTKNIIDWLLGVVNTLCNIKEFDNNYKDNTTQYDMDAFANYDILHSLLFRINFGGMQGDMKMLNSIIGVWLKRFNKGQKCNCEEVKLIDSDNVKILKLEEWKLDDKNNCAGIDFHCAPYIITKIAEKYNSYSDGEIKSCIWNCSSKINFRKNNKTTQKNIEIWKVIETEFYRMQNDILDRHIK